MKLKIIGINNIGYQKLFSDFGFKIVNLDVDGDVDFRLTKEEFINKYSDIK